MLMKQLTGGTVGGGGISEYTASGNSTSGTSPLPTTDQSTITVNTGLDTVTRFRFIGKVNSATDAWVLVDYDSTRTVGKCVTLGMTSGTASGAVAGESFPMSGTTYGTVITSISGGVVTMLTGSRTTWGRFTFSEWQAG